MSTTIPALFTGKVTRHEYNKSGSTVRKTRYYLLAIPLFAVTVVDIRAVTSTDDERTKKLLE
jgi:hypothetical protein